MSDMDDILDSTLDDLEDLPEFKPFPAGGHKVKVSLEAKKVNDNPCIEAKFKYVDCLQLADSEDIEPKEGDEASMLFMFNNEFGRGKFKKFAAPFAEKFGLKSNREIVETVQDIECAIISKLRTDKNDPDKAYMDVKELEIL